MNFVKKIFVNLRNKIGYIYVNLFYFLRKNKVSEKNKLSLILKKEGISEFFIKGISEKINLLLKNKSNSDFKTSVVIKNEFGIKALAIDLNSNVLWDFVFNETLFEIVNSHFKGKFYLRNMPTINFSYEGEKNTVQLFHNDWGLRQLAVMVNLMDLEEHNTHMEYVLKSNKKYLFFHPKRDSKKFKRNTKKTLKKLNTFKTTGKADSAFIFNAGNGLHRQVAGGKRIVLNLIFTDSLVHTNWSKNWAPEKNIYTGYWFQNKNTSGLTKKIESSPFKLKHFSLVLRKLKPKLFISKTYSSNYVSIK